MHPHTLHGNHDIRAPSQSWILLTLAGNTTHIFIIMSCSCRYPDAWTEGNTYTLLQDPYGQWRRNDSAWQLEALRKLRNLRSRKKWDRQNGNKNPWHIYGPLFHDPCDSCDSVQSE